MKPSVGATDAESAVVYADMDTRKPSRNQPGAKNKDKSPQEFKDDLTGNKILSYVNNFKSSQIK